MTEFYFKKLFSKKMNKEKEAGEVNPNQELQNPYVMGAQGRQEWNDRYFNLSKAIRHWQTAFASIVMLTIIMILIIAKMSMQSRIQPVVVETSQGMPVAILPVTGTLTNSVTLVNFAINQFIINARTIVADTQAQKTMLDKVYAYSAENTLSFLHDYYQKNNPFELAAQHTLQVSIINTTQISANTWQVTWDETQKNSNGDNAANVTRWMANVTYRLGEVNAAHLTENPFGIYITQVSWSPLPTQT